MWNHGFNQHLPSNIYTHGIYFRGKLSFTDCQFSIPSAAKQPFKVGLKEFAKTPKHVIHPLLQTEQNCTIMIIIDRMRPYWTQVGCNNPITNTFVCQYKNKTQKTTLLHLHDKYICHRGILVQDRCYNYFDRKTFAEVRKEYESCKANDGTIVDLSIQGDWFHYVSNYLILWHSYHCRSSR